MKADDSSPTLPESTRGGWRQVVLHWVPVLYLGFATALVPWTVYLALSLPPRSISAHYRTTWVGFDIVLLLVLARISWFAYRRNPRIVLTAAAGATMLVSDAWFDVTTSARGTAHTEALLAAVFLELPGAVLCALIARRGLRLLTQAARDHDSSARSDL